MLRKNGGCGFSKQFKSSYSGCLGRPRSKRRWSTTHEVSNFKGAGSPASVTHVAPEEKRFASSMRDTRLMDKGVKGPTLKEGNISSTSCRSAGVQEHIRVRFSSTTLGDVRNPSGEWGQSSGKRLYHT